MTQAHPPVPQVVRTVNDLRAAIASLRAAGRTVGLVPTMGALHPGHLALVHAAQADGHAAVVSIFVNPTQFGPTEDLARYPRTPEADLAMLATAGAALVFMPTPADMYFPGEDLQIRLPQLASVWEGASRPGHFDGVALVVAKLLIQALPDAAYFGQKDFQQTVVIRRLARDLFLPVQIHVQPTVREPDGLALSSRNRYLTPELRQQAPVLFQALQAAATALREGYSVPGAGTAFHRTLASAPDFRLDYLSLVDPDTLEYLPEWAPGEPGVWITAAWLGTTRLLDNLPM